MKSKILPSKKYLLITSILLLFCIVVYGFLDFKLRTETNVEIEWSDSVIINGIPYYNIENKQIESDSLIGNKIGEVLFNVSENIHDPNYIFKNGDATFLEVGTPIYWFGCHNHLFSVTQIARPVFVADFAKSSMSFEQVCSLMLKRKPDYPPIPALS